MRRVLISQACPRIRKDQAAKALCERCLLPGSWRQQTEAAKGAHSKLEAPGFPREQPHLLSRPRWASSKHKLNPDPMCGFQKNENGKKISVKRISNTPFKSRKKYIRGTVTILWTKRRCEGLGLRAKREQGREGRVFLPSPGRWGGREQAVWSSCRRHCTLLPEAAAP